MSTFPKTRAAAGYAGRHGRTGLARSRAIVLLKRLNACEAAIAGASGQLPLNVAGLLRGLVLAARDLAGPPGWPLAAMIQTSPRSPPCKPPVSPRRWPRSMRSAPGCCGHGTPPYGAARDGTAGDSARPGQPAHGPLPGSEEGKSSHALNWPSSAPGSTTPSTGLLSPPPPVTAA